MKTDNKDIVIYIRESKKGDTIQLCKRVMENGRVKYKRLSTGVIAIEENLIYYRHNASKEWDKLYSKAVYKPVLFQEFLEQKALKFINADCSEKTKKDNLQKIKDYLLPFFKKSDIKTIDVTDINNWQLELKEQKGTDLTKRCKSILKRVFDEAVINKIIATNPCSNSKKLKIRQKEKKIREIYYKEEIRKMIDNAKGWLKVFILMMAFVGIRTNEVIALRWEDINWDEEKLFICRAVVDGKVTDEKGNWIPPKTGQRLIDIPKALITALKEHQKNSKSEWVFPSKKGEHYKNATYVNRRHFKPLLEKLGIEYRTLYSLRHSYATHALLAGVSVLYVAKQLGHADPATTLKFYARFMEQLGIDIKAKLDELLVY